MILKRQKENTLFQKREEEVHGSAVTERGATACSWGMVNRPGTQLPPAAQKPSRTTVHSMHHRALGTQSPALLTL